MAFQGLCPGPFLEQALFPSSGGCSFSALLHCLTVSLMEAVLPGRFCLPTPTVNGTVSCCLPCPATDWVYSDGAILLVQRLLSTPPNRFIGFERRSEIASWVNVAMLVTTVLLLLSFAVLPVKWTHCHYLSVCLAIGVGFMEVCFRSRGLPLRVTEDSSLPF